MSAPPPLPPILYEDLVRRALQEDLGRAGDVTSQAICEPGRTARAMLVARAGGTIAGLPMALEVFRQMDRSVRTSIERGDGRRVEAGGFLACVEGDAAGILTAERTALNLLGRLCGIATATRQLVDRVAAHGTQIAETRKTTPGLRALEKYAVRVGGGTNHRFGLDDAVMIKDNHRQIAGGVAEAVRRVRAQASPLLKIEVEVDNLDELREVLPLGVDIVLLDNFSPADLRSAVELAAGRVLTEASGGIRPENIEAVAATGVDRISLGWLTHSAPALDVALDVETGQPGETAS